MPVKKIKTTAQRHGNSQAQPAARRSAGRPPKVRSVNRTTKAATKGSAKTTTNSRSTTVKKKKNQTKRIAQPQVVVVTNQPLVTEEEFSAWQSARQVIEPSQDNQIIDNNQPVADTFLEVDNPESAILEPLPVDFDEEVVAQPVNRLYRNLALFFIGLIAVVIMVMFYYSLIRVKITVYPTDNQQKQGVIIDMIDTDPIPSGSMSAQFIEKSTEYRQTFKATGQRQVSGDGTLTGQVRLVNETGKDQPLVATTRLLTDSGVLYRLRNFVTVPAGGQVLAEVYADQVKLENTIQAKAKFTIPGLWSGLQEKIYAIADQPIVFQTNQQSFILADDLERAIVQAKQGATEQLKGLLAQEQDGKAAAYWLDNSLWEIDSDGQVDEVKNEFTVIVKASAGLAIFDIEELLDLLNNYNNSNLKIDENSLSYQLTAWQPEQHYAKINISYNAELANDQVDQLIDKRELVGLDRAQLEEYLANQAGLATYKIVWQPGFLKKVPGTDKIILQLGKQ